MQDILFPFYVRFLVIIKSTAVSVTWSNGHSCSSLPALLFVLCTQHSVIVHQGFRKDKIIASHTCFGGHMDVNC